MHVFVDCDGVLAAFAEHVFQLFGKYPRELPDDAMWDQIIATPEFWSTMPVKYGAHALWRATHAFHPTVLTGCPKRDFEHAATQKVIWLKRHFGDTVKVITCHGRNKPFYMTGPGDILVDDFPSHVRRWTKAGGRAIHYRTAEQARREFNLAVIDIGDMVQVSVADAYVLPEPSKIVDIKEYDGDHWVFIADSSSAVRIQNVELVAK